jgi:hypothetical protein
MSIIDGGAKLFVGMSSTKKFSPDSRSVEKQDAPSTQISAEDLGVDKDLIFRSPKPSPLLSKETVDEVVKRIADMNGDAIRKLLSQMEGQRWLLPLDPKTELSYRFFALCNILDMIPEMEEQK